MPNKILGWEGVCYIPGDGEPDPQGRVEIMTTHASEMKETPEQAWEEAKKLGEKHEATDFLGIRPITTQERRPRRLITLAIYDEMDGDEDSTDS